VKPPVVPVFVKAAIGQHFIIKHTVRQSATPAEFITGHISPIQLVGYKFGSQCGDIFFGHMIKEKKGTGFLIFGYILDDLLNVFSI
jgi:hypothetical protein